ncbi:MAG: 5-Nucleotidase-like protein, partial [Thermoleophilia bacterium]|nr:5-Nucleotidase-like protein [Thermoleophilia bacterium]
AAILTDPTVAAMVKRFHAAVAPRTERVVTDLKAPLTREATPAGETALGAVIAEAQRVFAKADVGLMNNGGVRQDLAATGPLKWGTVFGVQPFANRVMLLDLTGAELRETLEQQFDAKGGAKILQIAGMTVHMDLTKPVGSRIVSVTMADGSALDPAKSYKVAANSFIADGGDGYVALKKGRGRKDLGVDLDALVAYLGSGAPLPAAAPGRIVLVAGALPEGAH